MAGTAFGHFVVNDMIAVWFGMITFLLSERYFIATTIGRAKTEILDSIKIDPSTKQLEDIRDALNHIKDNAHKCKKICNTRLFSEISEPAHK